MEELGQSLAVKVAYVLVGTPQAPENIKLNEPLNNNRECLHCRAGARSFLKQAPCTSPTLICAGNQGK